ncbi:hypothetical protein EV426DRAFT_360346 [Tirmania nivea]|nr:hypothetical protein EV426DRAFT_360346 [Tirmania nivea]
MERSISPSKRAGDDLNAIDNRHHQRARSGDTLVRNGQWHDNPPMRRRHSVAIPTLALGQNSRDESRHPTCAEPNFVITPTTTAPYTLAVGSYLQAPTVDRYFQVSATNSYFQPPVLGCQPPTVDRYFQAPAAGSYSQAPGLPTGYLSPDTCYWNVNAGSSSSIPEFSSGRASPNVSSSSPGSSPNANRRLSESSISQVLESMQVPSVQSTLEGLHIRVTQEEMSLDVQMDEEICYGMVGILYIIYCTKAGNSLLNISVA